MTASAPIDLNQGLPTPREVAGRPLVFRPRRDFGFPLTVGVVCGLLALGLLSAALMTLRAVVGGAFLAAIELVLALALGWFSVLMLRDFVDDRRFNRRRVEVHFELDRVEIRDRAGVERVALADAASHPLLRGLAVDRRIYTLTRTRAACLGLAADADVRLVLETLALLHPDEQHSLDDDDAPPPARPRYAIIVRPGEINFFSDDPDDPDDLDDARSSGLPLYRVATEWDPEARAHAPRLTPAAVTRISGGEPTA